MNKSMTAMVKLPDGYTATGKIDQYERLAYGLLRIKFTDGATVTVHAVNAAIVIEEKKDDSK